MCNEIVWCTGVHIENSKSLTSWIGFENHSHAPEHLSFGQCWITFMSVSYQMQEFPKSPVSCSNVIVKHLGVTGADDRKIPNRTTFACLILCWSWIQIIFSLHRSPSSHLSLSLFLNHCISSTGVLLAITVKYLYEKAKCLWYCDSSLLTCNCLNHMDHFHLSCSNGSVAPINLMTTTCQKGIFAKHLPFRSFSHTTFSII